MEVVGRAEWKLAEAVRAFGYDFRGKVVLDIGSSTGGFTELALRQGAKKVIAVEKGTRQMKAPLRFDPKVELHEKTDIFEFKLTGGGDADEEGMGVNGGEVDTILADVSFVSLREVLKYAKERLVGDGENVAHGREGKRAVSEYEGPDFLVMLKPQFEARPEQLNRGVVKNERMRREIIKGFEEWLKREGFVVKKKRDNETTGKNGNRERFYWLVCAGGREG